MISIICLIVLGQKSVPLHTCSRRWRLESEYGFFDEIRLCRERLRLITENIPLKLPEQNTFTVDAVFCQTSINILIIFKNQSWTLWETFRKSPDLGPRVRMNLLCYSRTSRLDFSEQGIIYSNLSISGQSQFFLVSLSREPNGRSIDIDKILLLVRLTRVTYLSGGNCNQRKL